MKRLVLLFAALLVAGCGEKRSSEGSDSTGESAEPSADTAKPPVADSPSEEPSGTPNSLSDADVKRLLKEAVEGDSIEGRDTIHGNLIYKTNESEPYSGWVKMMYDSGQVRGLAQFKDGKDYGLQTQWHENGQKEDETPFKDGKEDGLRTKWHENGQKWLEKTFEDGVWLGGSEKYWNSKGEEVETRKEAQGLESTGENPMPSSY